MATNISMEDIEARARALGIDLSAVDLDSITLPPGEDFGIISDDEEELYHEEPIEMETGFGNVIVVDNLLVVPPEKYEKLEGVIRKIYSQIGVIREDGLRMPLDPETKKTLGYCFIEYNTTQPLLLQFFQAPVASSSPKQNREKLLVKDFLEREYLLSSFRSRVFFVSKDRCIYGVALVKVFTAMYFLKCRFALTRP